MISELFISCLCTISSTASFVSQNAPSLTIVVDKVNELNQMFVSAGKNGAKDTTTEYYCYVYDLDTLQQNIYVDLAEENGYFVLDFNLELIDYDFDCDYPLLKEYKKEVFYKQHEFFWKEGSGDYIAFDKKSKRFDNYDPNAVIGSPDLVSSIIEYNDITSYLYNKYGGSFTLFNSGKLSGLSTSANSDGYKQYDESVFVQYNNGTYYSEGNCGLVSTSNALSYYSHYKGSSGFPSYSSTTSVSPYGNMGLFMQATSHGYQAKSGTVSLHTLYKVERDYAINVGYVVGGLNDTQTAQIFTSTASYYGYSSSFVPYSDANSTKSLIMSSISNGVPLQLRTQNDMVYGGHGMMITGYRTYTATIFLGGPPVPISVFCVSVYDGQSSSERWYDIEQLSTYPFSSSGYRATSVNVAECIVY